MMMTIALAMMKWSMSCDTMALRRKQLVATPSSSTSSTTTIAVEAVSGNTQVPQATAALPPL